MIFTAIQKEALRAIVMVSLVFGAAGAAVVLGSHPGTAPPPGSSTVIPIDWSGARISLTTVEVAPPTGCLALTYPADEAELRAYTGNLSSYYGGWNYLFPGGDLRGGAVASAAPGAATPPAAPEHSGTNNQVAGVDEADMVKTDGYYIYAATGGRVVIVKAFPADQMEVASTIDLGGYANGIFVLGNRLVVILQPMYAYPASGGAMGASLMPVYYNPSIELQVYDITDRAAPQILFNYSVQGIYTGARMIGDFVYLVSGYSLYEVDGKIQLPTIYRNGELTQIGPSAIGVPLAAHNATYLTTILSLNVSKADSVRPFSFLAEGNGEVYVSAHNLYILGSDYTYSENWSLLRTETVVSKYSFYQGAVTCYFGASVPGTVLNQFSADEYAKGGHPYLRIATTLRAGDWQNSSAGVYVLDERLNRVGAVEGLAPGESVQTTRFLGDRGYLVTFRQVDPLFVLDLATPQDPHVIGELTLPGFSEYLEPIDANHLVGIGVDASRATRGSGLKLSLFDVSDSANPREVANYTFGGTYASSEAQYDHHAVLWMPPTQQRQGLLVIPVQTYDYTVDSRYGGTSFQGAYVFAVDPFQGFTLLAKIAHDPIATGMDYYGSSYTYTPTVRRSLYIGDTLYTISDSAIKANALVGFAEVASVSLGVPYTGYCCYTMGGGIGSAPPPAGGTPTPL
jgi:inhibitor of cysteine peptidase